MPSTYTPTSPLSLIYKKLQSPPIGTPCSFEDETLAAFATRSHTVVNVPSWLQVYNVVYNDVDNIVEFAVRVIPAVAEGMAPGNYTATIKASFEYDNNGWNQFTDGVGFTVNLEIQDTVVLQVSPSSMLFSYVVGGTNPASKLLQISSENSWSLTKSETWVTLSATSGSNNGNVTVGVDPTGLPVGNHPAIVTVDDGVYTKQVGITLSITEADTPTNYLYVSPVSFEFNSEHQVANLDTKNLTLEVSHDWNTVISESWLNLSQESGVAGLFNLELSVDSAALAVGNYTAEIEFSTATIVKKIYVVLKVLIIETQGVESDTLYFADDRNKVSASNISGNSFLVIEGTTFTAAKNVSYKQEAPYFQGIAEVVVGEETNVLLKSTAPTSNLTSRVQSNVTPTRVNLTIFDENKTTGSLSQIDQLQNIYFLKGKTPQISGRICYIPSVVYVTKNAIISVSTTNAPTNIVVTGPENTYNISNTLPTNLKTYNALVNLADYPFEVGDIIDIDFAGINVRAVIKPEQATSVKIAFENEWGDYEFLEATGIYEDRSTAKQTVTELQEDADKITRIVNIDLGKDYVINTGWIHSKEEVVWWNKLLSSKRVFVYEDTTPIEIVLTTKAMLLTKTRQHLNAFSLRFKKALV